MNQTRHWLWPRRKFSDRQINSSTITPSSFSFGPHKVLNLSKFSSASEDSRRCWPPKLSYYCNFCRREFRSAQALGGHMNVHRVDRAMMKLASTYNLNPSTSLECNLNPNSSFGYSQSSEENISKNFLVEGSMDLKVGRESWKIGEMDWRKRKEFCVGYDTVSKKKLRKTTDLMLDFSCTSYKGEVEIYKPDEVVKFEELDLELRLGDPPRLNQCCNVVNCDWL